MIVAQWLEHDAAQHAPAFLYHLGDVVYYDGEHGSYYQQFYEPYLHYPAPIFAIPGNHDTDVGVPPNHTALEPFMANFCDTTPEHLPDAREVERTTMIQPNCYWTLNTPMATIVGLATNAPDHGEVKQDQIDWLVGELRDAPRERALLVALHHPPLSADDHHGASLAMRELLDNAFAQADRVPDLVLSGHVHNYQRFQRKLAKPPDTHLHRRRRRRLPQPAQPRQGRRRTTTDPLDRPRQRLHPGQLLAGTPPRLPPPQHHQDTDPRRLHHRATPQESWTDGPVTAIDHFQIRIRRP